MLESNKLDDYWAEFARYCKPTSNEILAIHKLKALQQGRMSVEALHSCVNVLVQEAGFAVELQECVVHDNLIHYIKDEKVWHKITWEVNGITLTRVL